MKRRTDTDLWQPTPLHWWGLGLALTLGSLPHLLRIPLPLGIMWLILVGWRLYLGLHPRRLPPVWTKFALVVLTGLLLVALHGSLIGREPGTSLLVMMGALKLFELRQKRDAFLVIFLSYFLAAVEGLFSQGLLVSGYVVMAVWLITGVWLLLARATPGNDWQGSLRSSARLLLQAVPIMLVLFVLFPRIPGPLWRLPGDAHSGMTGLSGEMEPGRIGQLAQSDAVAFRVHFTGPVPPPAQRYWRGPVFEMTDGRRWWPRAAPRESRPALLPGGDPVDYVVTLEPHNQPWLLALDIPVVVEARAEQAASFDWQAPENITEPLRYSARSYPDYRMQNLALNAWQYNLALPSRLSPRVRDLARRWQDASRTPGAIVQQALDYFHTEPFVYTLTPPRLGDAPVDEFLFETRRGFCEHYASAFVMLVRAAGLPARVVTGYQGGEINPLDDYLIVRQSDAHAWAEVWLPGQGWVRVDPTAAVAPERIERSFDPGLQRQGSPIRFSLADNSLLLQGWRQARFAWDAVNNRWQQWVIGYGPERQRDFLQRLGLPDVSWRGLALTMFIGVSLVVGLLAVWILFRRQRPADPALRLYSRFCHRLARQGLRHQAHEGPRAFLQRVRSARPDLAEASTLITNLYIAERYGAHPDPTRLRRLAAAVRAFRPGKISARP